jgi:hypothetical protein
MDTEGANTQKARNVLLAKTAVVVMVGALN